MRSGLSTLSLLILFAGNSKSSPVAEEFQRVQARADGNVTSAVLDGVTYLNKGLVAFGLIPSNFRESTGDTLGGFGSAIALKRGSWRKGADGKFSGTITAHPDRGFNVDTTINYQARQHEIDFVLTPYYDTQNLDFQIAQTTLQLDYKNTTLLVERQNKKTTGLDPASVRKAQFGQQLIPFLDPALPIASAADNRLVLDVEGLVLNRDGTYWISDEYGPYIYRFSSNGHLIQTIQPPSAALPRDATGAFNFTSDSNPATGRSPNQGFEGLTVDESTGTLYAMLQSAAIQDGGDSKSTSRFTRLFAFNVANPLVRPRLVGEWVVPLPLSSKGNTLGCSEIHFVSPGVFMALSRDGDGHGGDDNNSKYKQADLFSISKATDIHNTKFDDPANPIAIAGVLDTSITPAEYVSFVNFIEPTQLARFGLHNGKPADATLIDAKWESLALAPVGESAFPNDYFLFTAADNDFISTQGVSLGVPFNAGLDVDNQVLVFRVTLPSVREGSVERSIGL
ncbi:esterase-like activity of phytase-domain-containing protein [Crassisporium funariophilum]|nr:esterase-like activity of phytase-domain-containing protein [Crassisporium funariophilum]